MLLLSLHSPIQPSPVCRPPSFRGSGHGGGLYSPIITHKICPVWPRRGWKCPFQPYRGFLFLLNPVESLWEAAQVPFYLSQFEKKLRSLSTQLQRAKYLRNVSFCIGSDSQTFILFLPFLWAAGQGKRPHYAPPELLRRCTRCRWCAWFPLHSLWAIQRYTDFIKAYFMSSPAQTYSMNFAILRKNDK